MSKEDKSITEEKEPEQKPATADANKKQKKRNRNRKKNNGQKATIAETSTGRNDSTVNRVDGGIKAKKAFVKPDHKKFQNHKNIKELDKKDATHISENRLRALGINPKKYQNKLIYGGKD